MSNRATRNGAALSLLIVSSLIVGGVFAAIFAVGPVTRAGLCDEVAGVPTGDWTITTAQECTGLFRVDGTININGPAGSLTITDGGIIFPKDTTTAGHSLNVNAGGSLVLINSIVSTEPGISPYLHLALTVSGAGSEFTMRNGAALVFPGWFNATGATINITDSTITGFEDSVIDPTGLDTDSNNDGPVIDWASSTSASIYRSRIERIYEGALAANVSLRTDSRLYAYDSYIGVDYSNDASRHNTLTVDGTSAAYLYGVTIDRTQDPSTLSDAQPAFVPAAGGTVDLLRWARVNAIDSTNFPVSGATLAATLSPSSTPAQFPDSGSATPTARTDWYVRTTFSQPAWDRTNANGEARLPLHTDRITVGSLPNAESFGNYRIVATFLASTASGSVSFPPYPFVSSADNARTLVLSFDIQVRSGPDLELRQSDYDTTLTVIQNQPFNVPVTIYNEGQTIATGVVLAAYLDEDPGNEVARVGGLTVGSGGSLGQTLNIGALALSGTHNLTLVVDPDNTINEGTSGQENNNWANLTLFLQPPPEGFVTLAAPDPSQRVEPGAQLVVTGFVQEPDAVGIPGVVLNVELRHQGNLIDDAQATSGTGGFFQAILDVPAGAAEGDYTVSVTPAAGTIIPESRTVVVQRNVPFLEQRVPVLGIPMWLLLIIVAAAAAILIGITLYMKVYGLGKMVECGECGAFIPEDATSCPKCGVEFEKDMAKCSNCQAWIPVDVRQCPECGVEFATGQVEMADYQEKMRLQYDEVVTKFKEEASRQLGRALSDREFQEWWRKQPTFVTFEDWLREEEEMRKMGSKPCPTCGTLNSVTATVCHKCGSLMRETTRPPGSGGGGAAPVIQARRPGAPPPPEGPAGGQAAPYGPPPGGAAPGTEAIPRRVIRRPSTAQPVVQKKVIKRPTGEGQQGEGQSESNAEKSEDEL